MVKYPPNEEATEVARSRADLLSKSGEDVAAVSFVTDFFGQKVLLYFSYFSS